MIGLLSFVCLGIGIFLFGVSLFASAVFLVLFVLTALIAMLGSKKTIDRALHGLDASVSDRVIDSIFDGLF